LRLRNSVAVATPATRTNDGVGYGWVLANRTIQFSTTARGIMEVSSEQVAWSDADTVCRLFLLESIVNTSHQAVVQNFCTKLQAHLDSGDELRKALNKVKPIFDSAKAEQQIAMRDPVAILIGKYKKVKPIRLEKGAYKGYLGFDAHGSAEENQARTMLQYYFPSKVKVVGSSTKPKGSAQVDEAEELLKKLYSLSKKDQARFDVLYTNDKKASRK